jgi:energy-coupling factor transporter ATP-binding protein EcfA2
MSAPVVSARRFSLRAGSGGRRTILDSVSFQIPPGAILGITGPSGSGKTALLASLGGLLRLWLPDAKMEGSLEVFGKTWTGAREQAHVYFVAENPYAQVSGLKTTVAGEVVVALEMRGVRRPEMSSRLEESLSKCGLAERRDSRLEWLSGGELERMHCASSLAVGPTIALFDQPFAELDAAFQAELPALLRAQAVATGGFAAMTFSADEVPHEWFDLVLELKPERAQLRRSSSLDFHSSTSAPTDTRGEHLALCVEDLWFRYAAEAPWMFEGLSLKVYAGQGALILGRNGSGKSTFFRLVVGLLRAAGGVIVIGSEGEKVVPLRWPEGVSVAFQNPDPYFLFSTVRQEFLHFESRDSILDPIEVMHMLGLEGYLDLNPLDLPRSARKRLSIAIAALASRRLLLLDEPSQYQDSGEIIGLAALLRGALARGIGIACSTHDRRLASMLKDFTRIELSVSD